MPKAPKGSTQKVQNRSLLHTSCCCCCKPHTPLTPMRNCQPPKVAPPWPRTDGNVRSASAWWIDPCGPPRGQITAYQCTANRSPHGSPLAGAGIDGETGGSWWCRFGSGGVGVLGGNSGNDSLGGCVRWVSMNRQVLEHVVS